MQMIDHIVILVTDLAQAQADYAALGFTVLPGGTHADGATHNALISFADGTYLELIAFLREAPEHRWYHYTDYGEGLIDFALLPDAIGAEIAAAQSRGVRYLGPFDGGRVRPDGVQIAWQSGLQPSADLPFLCFDVTPRELRVAGGAATQHANGVTGLASVTVAVDDLAASVTHYTALLGHGPQPEDPHPHMTLIAEPKRAAFAVGGALIGLAEPQGQTPHSAQLRDHLDMRGEGLFALILRGSQTATLDPVLTHGARIVTVAGV